MISKKDRVYAALQGEVLDRVPIGFWMHFPTSSFYGEASVKAHVNFFEQSGTDLCKVMTEYIYPCHSDIKAGKDWANVPIYNESAEFIQKQAALINEIKKLCPNSPILGTVHGTVASSSHTLLGVPKYDVIGRYALMYHLRTEPEAVGTAFSRISDTLCAMVRAQVKAGADGIYFAALGGESDGFTDEEHAKYIAPCDIKIINAAYEAGAKFVVLHMCKPKVELKRFLVYPCDVINWGIEESGVSLLEGRKMFPQKVLLGGFNNHHGALIEGSIEEIQTSIKSIFNEVGTKKIILGSDCTLPGNLSYDNIKKVRECLDLENR